MALTNDEADLSKIKHSDLKQILAQILHKDISKRLTILELIEDPWLCDNGNDPIDLDLSSISGYASEINATWEKQGQQLDQSFVTNQLSNNTGY